jgi:hypothetical protein
MKIRKIKIILMMFLTVFVFLFSSTLVSAEVTEYSDVLDDLRTDKTFDISKYPNMTYDYWLQINQDEDKSNDQSLIQVIQIAESSSKELYIYTYEPLNSLENLNSTSILMSTNFSKNGEFKDGELKDFDLELVSHYSVFKKYVVKNFTVSDEVYRFYNLVTIYRKYNERFDNVVTGGELESGEYGHDVGQQWCVYYLNDDIVYEMSTFKTIELKPVFTGNAVFKTPFNINNLLNKFNEGKLWFIAFKPLDYNIDYIIDAELHYNIREMLYIEGQEDNAEFYPYGSNYDSSQIIKPGDSNYETGGFSGDLYVTLNKSGVGSFNGSQSGLLSYTYSWNEIMKGKDFTDLCNKQNLKITNVDLINQDDIWVFNFLQTESYYKYYSPYVFNYSHDIKDITIIRISFMDKGGNYYNLGVVTDKVNPDNKDDIYDKGFELKLNDLKDLLEKMFLILGIILLFMLFINLFTPIASIFKFIGQAFLFIFKILLLPFRLIGDLFKKKRY